MPAKLLRNGDVLELDLSRCRGAEFQDTLAKIKEVPGRRYDPERKLWCVPAEPAVAERVFYSIQPDADAELINWIREARTQAQQELTTPVPDDADLLIPWANQRAIWQPEYIEVAGEKTPFSGLMKHQRPVVEMAARLRRLLICDDMGGGKTGVSISAYAEWQHQNKYADGTGTLPDGPKLVICPSSVKGTWEEELNLWLDRPAYQIIDGSTPKSRHNQLAEAIREDAWAIVNWEQIRVKKATIEVKRRNGSKGKRSIEVMKEPLFEFPWMHTVDLDDWEPKLVEQARREKKPRLWSAVIADEVHRAKNRKAQQTRGLWNCRAPEGIMLGLSGTPLMNSPAELWAILKWLWPEQYTSYWRFHDDYCEEVEGYFGKILVGVKNPEALRFELRNRLVRRTKQQMGLNLKGKKRIGVPMELNKGQRKLYDEAAVQMWLQVEQDAPTMRPQDRKLLAEVAQGNAPASMMYRLPNGASRTVRLRQIIETPANLGGPDDSAVLDDVVERVMDSRPEQWAVFCEFKPTTECLRERFEKRGINAVVYHGDVDPEERAEIKKRYQRGEIDVVIGTIKAMKEGITLTAGNNQYWVSRDWTPDNNEQGEDRQHRIGQDKLVLVWIAQPHDTVAVDKVEPKNKLKERIVRTVLPKDEIKEVVHTT